MANICVITGASSGIGRETARVFSQGGFFIVGIGRNRQALTEVQKECGGKDRFASYVHDLGNTHNIKSLCHEITQRHPVLHGLVNNAGIGCFKSIEETSAEEFRHIIDTNLTAAFLMTRYLLAALEASGDGRIINVASVAGRRVFKHLSAYSASKFALTGLSHVLRREFRFHLRPVKVSVVHPPAVRTEFFKRAGYPQYEEDHPGAKLIQAHDVAQVIFRLFHRYKREVIITPRAWILDKVAAVCPSLVEWLEDKVQQAPKGEKIKVRK